MEKLKPKAVSKILRNTHIHSHTQTHYEEQDQAEADVVNIIKKKTKINREKPINELQKQMQRKPKINQIKVLSKQQYNTIRV